MFVLFSYPSSYFRVTSHSHSQVGDDIERIRQEYAALCRCDSPYLVRYYGTYVFGSALWVVMEYLGGGSVVDLVSRSAARRVSSSFTRASAPPSPVHCGALFLSSPPSTPFTTLFLLFTQLTLPF